MIWRVGHEAKVTKVVEEMGYGDLEGLYHSSSKAKPSSSQDWK